MVTEIRRKPEFPQRAGRDTHTHLVKDDDEVARWTQWGAQERMTHKLSMPSALPRARREPWLMSGGLDVPRRTCHPARHLASTATEEGIRRTQQQSVPPQVPQVGHAGGETGRRASIRRPMLVASVADAIMY